MTLLEIKHLNKSYMLAGKEKVPVLRDVNVTFESGEFVSILGESGSGKSTLMNIIGGMDSDYEGDVMIQGKTLREMKEIEIDAYRKDKIGFIFQSFNLIPHLSVLENVMIAMQMTDHSEKERTQRAKEILTEIGLKDHMHKRPNQLSGGQKQRVAIARALSNDPEIILADEPTGSLDQETSEQILELLDSIAKKGVLIITVTHSQRVADFGSRIVSVEDGCIKEDLFLKERYTSAKETTQKNGKNLSFAASFKLAINNMTLNTKRNMLVATGGAIGILSVILMLSLGSGVTSYINDQINSSMNPLLVDVVKTSDKGEMKHQEGPPMDEFANEPFTEQDINTISNIANVDSIEKVTTISGKSNVVFNGKNKELSDLETLTDSITADQIEAGTLPNENQVMLTASFAKSLSGDETYKSLVGKPVNLYINEMDGQNQPVTVETQWVVSGIYDQEDKGPIRGAGAYVSYSTLENAYSKLNLVVHPKQINAYAENQDDVVSIKEAVAKAGFQSSPIASIMERITTYVKMASWVLSGIAGISLLVSGIMILVVLNISVVERTREIGILRAIGARKKDIRRIFFSESALLGLLSGVIAVAVAWVISLVLNNILSNTFGVELIQLTPVYMLFGIVVSTLISVVAGVLPSSKAAKLDPMESLRYE
ncbi:ABC transporter ATP-binding protein/permease [Paenibacillus macquariensis]|uniref:ABC-type lipoprotein export system, ATPase component n=1 Tax=Paenibacillus macquariensis TaxID=948756 RepID=A0ABY1JUI3_9BACL|nr:ABC transporter ATP-binding protein/permease [Paenibacillus macquariensis]MEC0090963.1 ATP-binding cassette domain-containing protein [Paenibacillus macquariensis]OAB34687.1 ABC transporter [Paenibacillus macquariensis subsp. macquariensis]SIQ79778.1 ABC-type lipoprotein export system, ATPase component [Paenibacillus macquariensis]